MQLVKEEKEYELLALGHPQYIWFLFFPLAGGVPGYYRDQLTAVLKQFTPKPTIVAMRMSHDPMDKMYHCKNLIEQAHLYCEILQTIQPKGAYQLCGWSYGGVLAFEVARQLEAQGKLIAAVVNIDHPPPAFETPSILIDRVARIILYFVSAIFFNRKELEETKHILLETLTHQIEKEKIALQKKKASLTTIVVNLFNLSIRTSEAILNENDAKGFILALQRAKTNQRLLSNYAFDLVPPLLRAPFSIFEAKEKVPIITGTNDYQAWSQFAKKPIIYQLEGNHFTLFSKSAFKKTWQNFYKDFNKYTTLMSFKKCTQNSLHSIESSLVDIFNSRYKTEFEMTMHNTLVKLDITKRNPFFGKIVQGYVIKTKQQNALFNVLSHIFDKLAFVDLIRFAQACKFLFCFIHMKLEHQGFRINIKTLQQLKKFGFFNTMQVRRVELSADHLFSLTRVTSINPLTSSHGLSAGSS